MLEKVLKMYLYIIFCYKAYIIQRTSSFKINNFIVIIFG